MAGANQKQAQKLNRADIYKKLLENYEEWRSLMKLIEAEERDLRSEFLRIIDKAKMEKVMRHIGAEHQ